jgi:hypothetical protein
MSLEIVRQVDRQHPELLRTNIGSTCHEFTKKVIEALRAHGHDAYLMCKSPGEGQYVPPSFQPRAVIGLDGKTYQCSGVSHDAIWSDGQQFDTIADANDGPDPILKGNTWDRLVGQPVWNAIAREHWRNNNPPLKQGVPVPPQPQPPSKPTYPSYEELGGDSGGIAITRQLEADYKRAGRPGLDGDCGAWQQRVSYDFLTGVCKTVQESIAKHRAEWLAALGLPPS